jgi:hypothetical protein
MREQMLPRTALPTPELFEKEREPLKDVLPGAKAEEQLKKPQVWLLHRVELWTGFAHLFRPTYAGANVGHPSRVVQLVGTERLRRLEP